ncbi:MAG: 16S rRNA processing protein RimM [Glaciecola sp.]|jgi:16S rRNA processing protein RimM
MNLSEYFLIGKIGKPKSFKGEVFFIIEDDEVFFALGKITEMKLLIRNKLIVYPIENMSVKSNNKVTLKFKGFDTIDMANMIKNCEVYVKNNELPASGDDNVFTHELIGCMVVDEKLGEIGLIDYIDKSSAQELVYIEKDGEELIFPLIDEFLVSIDLASKKVITNLPEGLLDINKEE